MCNHLVLRWAFPEQAHMTDQHGTDMTYRMIHVQLDLKGDYRNVTYHIRLRYST
jgi:hypothetical protein